MTEKQIKKVRHAFGLDHAKKPYRNYYQTCGDDSDWETLVAGGFAEKQSDGSKLIYFATLKALQAVFRKNATRAYFDAINA